MIGQRIKKYQLIIVIVNLISFAKALEIENIITEDLGKIENFKYQVVVDNNQYGLCGGSIYKDNLIITAAHCLYNYKHELVTTNIKVIAGIDDQFIQRDKKVIIPVVEFYILKNYEKKHKWYIGDIAVLKLKESLPFDENSNLSKLQLADKEYDKSVQPILTGFGWNKITETKIERSKITKIDGSRDGKLRYAKTDIIEKSQCQVEYSTYPKSLLRFYPFGIWFFKKYFTVEDSHICARVVQPVRGHYRGSCRGDSGSPLVVDDKILIGVLTLTTRNCDESIAPGVYTKVLYFKDFIESVRDGKIDSYKVNVVRVLQY